MPGQETNPHLGVQNVSTGPATADPGAHRRLTFPQGQRAKSRVGVAFTRQALQDWFPELPPPAEADVVMVVAELLGNATCHAGGPLALDLGAAADDSVLRIMDAGSG